MVGLSVATKKEAGNADFFGGEEHCLNIFLNELEIKTESLQSLSFIFSAFESFFFKNLVSDFLKDRRNNSFVLLLSILVKNTCHHSSTVVLSLN